MGPHHQRRDGLSADTRRWCWGFDVPAPTAKEIHVRLSSTPPPENIRRKIADVPVTIIADTTSGALLLAGFDESSLNVLWLKATPATLADPRARRATRARAALDSRVQELIRRFCLDSLVTTTS
jgi:hypothetical protein